MVVLGACVCVLHVRCVYAWRVYATRRCAAFVAHVLTRGRLFPSHSHRTVYSYWWRTVIFKGSIG